MIPSRSKSMKIVIRVKIKLDGLALSLLTNGNLLIENRLMSIEIRNLEIDEEKHGLKIILSTDFSIKGNW